MAAPVDPTAAAAAALGEQPPVATPTEEEEETNVRREHVAELDTSEPTEVQVHAPGMEAMLAAGTWEELGLASELLQGVQSVRWPRPSKPQALAIPIVLSKDRPNLLLQSKNGSGKTGAFGLSALATVDPGVPKVQVIIMSPARELALQTTERLRELAKFMPGIKIDAVIGGTKGYTDKITAQVVVATPGKAVGLAQGRSPLLDLSGLKMLVIDEADDMIVRFPGEVAKIKSIASFRRAPPQVLLFSASFECLESSSPFFTTAKDFADQMLDRAAKPPTVIRIVHREELRNPLITHLVAQLPVAEQTPDAEFAAKIKFLLDMYSVMTVGQTMIFTNRRDSALEIAKRLRENKHSVSVITGEGKGGKAGTTMDERVRVREEFEKGVSKVLVCTDVLARGFDVRGVKLVINFDLPFAIHPQTKARFPDFPTFQHRCHRVARTFGEVGAVVHLEASPTDKRAIGDFLRHFKLPVVVLPADPTEAGLKVEEAMRTPLTPA